MVCGRCSSFFPSDFGAVDVDVDVDVDIDIVTAILCGSAICFMYAFVFSCVGAKQVFRLVSTGTIEELTYMRQIYKLQVSNAISPRRIGVCLMSVLSRGAIKRLVSDT